MHVDIDTDPVRGREVQVYLNGDRVHRAVAADTDRGWVEVVKMRDGRVVFDVNNHLVRERKRGFVELVNIITGAVIRREEPIVPASAGKRRTW